MLLTRKTSRHSRKDRQQTELEMLMIFCPPVSWCLVSQKDWETFESTGEKRGEKPPFKALKRVEGAEKW